MFRANFHKIGPFISTDHFVRHCFDTVG